MSMPRPPVKPCMLTYKCFNRLLSRDMVDIYVGEKNTHWVLHQKLLCHRSRHFRDLLYDQKKGSNKSDTIGLYEENDAAFKLFVGWLYSERVASPDTEEALSPLLDLYLMGEKWEIKKLVLESLDVVRKWYRSTNTMPSLRRVQYIYDNTDGESPMRKLLVSLVARMLLLGGPVPKHWKNALHHNGQLAVDIIECVQEWHLGSDKVPDPRDESVLPIVEGLKEKVEIKVEDEEEDFQLDWSRGRLGPDSDET